MVRLHIFMVVIGLWLFQSQHAHGASATFIGPKQLNEIETAAISTAGDNASVLVARSPSLQLLFDQPFSASGNDNVSIFTQPISGGAAIGEVRFGRLDGDNFQFAGRRFFLSGSTVSLNGFVERNCASFGGCNIIEILTRATSQNVEGVQVDYIQINGEVVSVTAPTPEPHIWGLMILGFLGIAWRAKTVRYQVAQTQRPPPTHNPNKRHVTPQPSGALSHLTPSRA